MTVEKRMTKESAVSPVVGVMLMLVVTIVIAAVIAAFASGVVTTTSPTPTVALQVVGVDDGDLVFMHAGGDPFNIQEVTLQLQGAEAGSQPREYSTANEQLLTMNDGKTGKIGTGDRFKAHDIRLSPDAFVQYTLLSTNSGNVITTGTFTMPAGVKSDLSGDVPTKLAISWSDPVSYEYKQAVSLETGDSSVFYLNAYNSDDEAISAATADSAYIIVTKPDSSKINVNYDAGSYGFPYTFSEAGSYTITAVINTYASDYHLEGFWPEADGYNPTTWTSGGSISVTVSEP